MRLYLTFGTTYGALRAESLLQQAGLSCEVVPKPREIRGSCGLAVRLPLADRDAALAALQSGRHAPRQQVSLP